MKDMMKIEMPDQSIWALPVSYIARNRAARYAHEFDGNIERSLKEDTVPHFEDDDYNITDWASNNMNWSDVEEHAEQISKGDVDYQEGWVNGEKSFSGEND